MFAASLISETEGADIPLSSEGGGAGGAVREAGGSFGKMEVAREEEYFRRLQRRQIMRLRKNISKEILLSQKLVREHQDAIARLENRIAELTQIEN
ncbi:hypothetical protein TNIN_236971 [Trichonephila inaurata madagascariensis]|uniref:ATP synthase F1 subunit epsilon n=1 Tax=Trichonephila inaurata madagascariensis TaxID=2747483 RepID=A0A8X6XT70_9ARAC|nr:hypothetical protein TNIN_236971 [Trichonephila inaurata madagascariensis]